MQLLSDDNGGKNKSVQLMYIGNYKYSSCSQKTERKQTKHFIPAHSPICTSVGIKDPCNSVNHTTKLFWLESTPRAI